MSSVNTSGSLIRDAVILCTGVIETLSGSQRDMQSKYRSAGSGWTDSKYQQLGDIVNECNSSIRKTLNELNGCLASLRNVEQAILEYESISLAGTVSVAGGSLASFNADRIRQITDERIVSSYQDYLARVPTDGSRGQWEREDQRGNSRFTPSDPVVMEVLSYFNQSSVQYINAVPDFSPFARHRTQDWGDFIAEVTIGHMNERTNSSDGFGRRRSAERYNPITYLGNYEQADIALAQSLSVEGRTVTPEQIAHFREQNNLTWHECIDMTTMQLIPTIVNDYFGHLGGTSEARTLRRMADIGELPDANELARIRDQE